MVELYDRPPVYEINRTGRSSLGSLAKTYISGIAKGASKTGVKLILYSTPMLKQIPPPKHENQNFGRETLVIFVILFMTETHKMVHI